MVWRLLKLMKMSNIPSNTLRVETFHCAQAALLFLPSKPRLSMLLGCLFR